MLTNKTEKILDNILYVALLALLFSAISAFILSKIENTKIDPDEIKIPGSLPGEVKNVDSSQSLKISEHTAGHTISIG